MAKKPNPFAKFEKSAADKKADKKSGLKEGSKAEMAMDKKQAKKGGFPAFKCGGSVKKR